MYPLRAARTCEREISADDQLNRQSGCGGKTLRPGFFHGEIDYRQTGLTGQFAATIIISVFEITAFFTGLHMTDMSASVREDTSLKIELLCLAAEIVLENGGETYRVEETAQRMAKGFGMGSLNIAAFPTSIFIEADGAARVRRISRRGTNLLRLTQVNEVSRRVERRTMTLEETQRELARIAAQEGPSQRTTLLACAVAAGSFSLLFGGGTGTFIVAFLIGMLVQMVQPLFAHMEMGAFFGNFTGGMLSAMLAEAMGLLIAYGSVNATIIGGIMPFLSGLAMTNAVRDTMYGDLVSGVTRAVEGLLLAAFTALGVYVGLSLFAMTGGMLG